MTILIKIVLLTTLFLGNYCYAAELSDEQQKQAQEIYTKVRCPTCVAQSVSDSSTIASTQIRAYIDEQVGMGQSENKIINDLRLYYGSSIIYEPVYGFDTILLWAIPLLFLIGALWRLLAKR